MKRIPEPELMENPAQVKAYAEADFSGSDSMVLIGLKKFLKQSGKTLDESNLIIDVACGPGNISELLATNWPSVRVIGIDGSMQMLMEAKRNLMKSDSKKFGKLSYENFDINSIANSEKSIPFFADVIVSNSALHHLHSPESFWMALKKLGDEKCIHFHRDLRRPCSIDKAYEMQEKYLMNSPEILKKDFYASLKASFTVDEVKQQLIDAGLSQLEVFEVDELYLEIIGYV